MTLKNAAFLALIATVLAAALLVWNLIFNLLNVVRGLIPAVSLVSALIYAFAAVGAAFFFYAFHRTQS